MYCQQCQLGKYTLSIYWKECETCPVETADCTNGVLSLKPGFSFK